MILSDFKAFIEEIPSFGKVLAVDWGQKRTGIALSDITQGYAFAHSTIKSSGNDLMEKIKVIAIDEKIVGIIIGLPTYIDGGESDTTRRVRKFSDVFAASDKIENIPITFIDETLSSLDAQELMSVANKQDQAKGLDAYAATVILTDALAKIQRIRDNGN